MSFDNLLVQRESGVAILTIQPLSVERARPPRPSTSSGRPAPIFRSTMPSAACIVTGSGEKACCGGAIFTSWLAIPPNTRDRARCAGNRHSISSNSLENVMPQ